LRRTAAVGSKAGDQLAHWGGRFLVILEANRFGGSRELARRLILALCFALLCFALRVLFCWFQRMMMMILENQASKQATVAPTHPVGEMLASW
jgi:hypothetical protein